MRNRVFAAVGLAFLGALFVLVSAPGLPRDLGLAPPDPASCGPAFTNVNHMLRQSEGTMSSPRPGVLVVAADEWAARADWIKHEQVMMLARNAACARETGLRLVKVEVRDPGGRVLAAGQHWNFSEQ